MAQVRIVWANQACLDFSGAPAMDDLIRLRFDPNAPFAHQLAALAARQLEELGTRQLIRFPTRDGEYVFDCLCKSAIIEAGRTGVLVQLVADKGKIAPAPADIPPLQEEARSPLAQEKKRLNGVIKDAKEQPQIFIQPDQQEAFVECDERQTLDFDLGHQANGFQIEPENVDEEDLQTLREIARMINGSSAPGPGRGGALPQVSKANDGRPAVATRSVERANEHDRPGGVPLQNGTVEDPLINRQPTPPNVTVKAGSTAKMSPDQGEGFKAGERNYFLESLPAALAIAMGGRLMRANEAFLYAFGFGSESELRKAGGLAVLFPESQKGVLIDDRKNSAKHTKRQKSSRSATITTLGVSRSGRKRRMHINFRNVSTGREPVQILILHEDAIWREPEKPQGPRQINDAFDESLDGQARHSLGQGSIDFLASVSHEVRTPLNSIIGFSELMKDERFGAVDRQRFRSYAGDIHTSAMHALSLINDLLDITKIVAGKPDLDFEVVKLNEVILESMSAMRAQAEQKKIDLRMVLGKEIPPLFADKRSMKQILLNLVSNAIKFTSSGGQVSVSSSSSNEGGVLLRIKDTGIGMRKDQIGTALEPFAQLDLVPPGKKEPVSGMQKGTGLGLPLTKALVKAHHAKFIIDSAPGQGTCVEIHFPVNSLAH